MKNYTWFFIIFVLFSFKFTFASVSITNGLTHKYKADNGETIEGEIILLNASQLNQRVTFSLNNAILSCNDKTYFTASQTHSKSSNTWFKSAVSEKILAPGESYVYRFSLHVPVNTLDGSYWSIIMVNIEKPIKEQMLQEKIGVLSKIRYAIQLLTDVNQLDEMHLEFDKIALNIKIPKKKQLEVVLNNQGQFIESTSVILEVYNNSGIKLETIEAKVKNIFPNACKAFVLDVSNLNPGEYECIVLAKSRDEYSGTNLSLSIE